MAPFESTDHGFISSSDDIEEGTTNQFFTQARAHASFSVTNTISPTYNGVTYLFGGLNLTNGTITYIPPPPVPDSVYVSVYKNEDQIVNVTGGVTTYADVSGMTIDYQSGSDYNESTGEFTAPREGIYIIDYAINVIDDAANYTEYIGAVVSVDRGSGFVREMTQNYSDTQQDTLLYTLRAHYMTQLIAGDIVKNEIEIFNTNTTIATIRGNATTARGTYQTIHSIT